MLALVTSGSSIGSYLYDAIRSCRHLQVGMVIVGERSVCIGCSANGLALVCVVCLFAPVKKVYR